MNKATNLLFFAIFSISIINTQSVLSCIPDDSGYESGSEGSTTDKD